MAPGAHLQSVKAVLPSRETVLSGHDKHVEAKEAPTLVEYLPTSQLKQFEDDEAPVAVEYLPASQLVHETLPYTILYFPAVHAKHKPPLGPVNPGLQTQLLTPVLEAGEFEFSGHN